MNSEDIESEGELDLSYIDEYVYEDDDNITNSTIDSETDENSILSDENTSTSLIDITSEDINLEQDSYEGSKKTSDIWNYFDITGQNRICKYCKKEYSKKTSTAVLWRHYRKYHESEVNDKIGQNRFQFKVPPHPSNIMYEKTKSLVEWIICDLKSFSIVESESFIKLIYKLDPRYRLPSQHTVKRLINQEFEQKRNAVPEFLQNITSKFSLTCDIWSSVKMESFIAIRDDHGSLTDDSNLSRFIGGSVRFGS